MISKSQHSERPENAPGGTAGMHVMGKSDGSVVPAKSANKGAAGAPAEPVEERDPAKRNADQDNQRRTLGRNQRGSSGREGVREAARKDGRLRFTALLHHIDEEMLTYSFAQRKRNAAVGVDGVTWQEYEGNLEEKVMGGSRSGVIPLPSGCERRSPQSSGSFASGCTARWARRHGGWRRSYRGG